jgi:hypothetical protein
MTKADVLELFKMIKSIYPTFEVTQEKIDIWAKVMKDMDFERVKVRSNEHFATNKFPPTIAEISAYAPPKNETLEKVKQWEKEAAEVSEETKRKFKQKLEELEQKIKEKSE